MQKVDDNHFASCHFADSLELEGIGAAAAGSS